MESQEMNASVLYGRIEQIENALADLYLTITTIACGLEAEKIEPQVIANLNSIAICVDSIQKYAHYALEPIKGDRNE